MDRKKRGIKVLDADSNRTEKQRSRTNIRRMDGLKGFTEAINSVFPSTTVQLCIVHMIRNSVKYVSYRDLKKIYTAVSEKVAELELEEFAEKWDKKYPVISNMWRRNWADIVPFFAFPEKIRRVIYTTNAIETINRQIRKIIKNKGVFPDDKSIMKIMYLALKNASKKWTMPLKNCALALNQFELLCGGMMLETAKLKYDLIEK